MRYEEILNEYRVGSCPRWVKEMPIEERHKWLHFLVEWLGGTYMGGQDASHLKMWEEFSRLFPTGLAEPKRLLRVVTLPIEYAAKDEFRLNRPAPGPVASWTSTKAGADCVAGVATDYAERDGKSSETVRMAISAEIQPQDILATIKTIRYAFLALCDGFHDRYPNQVKKVWAPEYNSYVSYDDMHPDFPRIGEPLLPAASAREGAPDYYRYNMDEIGYYESTMRDYKGGTLRQYEHVVRTRPVKAKKALIYRLGSKTMRYGNDDPHN